MPLPCWSELARSVSTQVNCILPFHLGRMWFSNPGLQHPEKSWMTPFCEAQRDLCISSLTLEAHTVLSCLCVFEIRDIFT